MQHFSQDISKPADSVILENVPLIEKVYSFGDEKTDEDMFRVLNKDNHYTFKVGNSESCAKYKCKDISEVYNTLNKINDGYSILNTDVKVRTY